MEIQALWDIMLCLLGKHFLLRLQTITEHLFFFDCMTMIFKALKSFVPPETNRTMAQHHIPGHLNL
jgi:hypothetical protein